MGPSDEVRAFVRRWAAMTQARDAERSADLYLRDPAPMVTFSDGERVRDWLDVRVRLGRDLGRHVVDSVEVHHLEAEDLSADTSIVSFVYDLHVRDLWGTPVVATRLASMTLTRTKDGFRIAQAHFSVPKGPT